LKLWDSRFQEGLDKFIEEYTESISFDHKLLEEDITGSIAHLKMLNKCGIVNDEEYAKIEKALLEILEEGKKIEKFPIEYEDIHTWVESKLKEKVGNIAGKLHTARSRNDQIVLDEKLYIRRKIKEIVNELEELQKTIIEHAEREIDALLPAYTHLQHAQPISLAFHLMAYFYMFERDIDRFKTTLKRHNKCPLGSAACCGTSIPIDRFTTSRILDFDEPTENAMDTVASRDFILEVLSNCAITMINLSRLCEEIVIWNTDEFSFIKLSDRVTTGSSIMPQKRNPDVAELTRGKAGRVIGNLVSLLVTLKGLPLSYNRDLQEDKEPLFDSIETTINAIKAVNIMLKEATFLRENMRKQLEKGYVEAADVAEYLVKKGVPFREAHRIVGKIVNYLDRQNKKFKELSLEEYKKFCDLFEKDVYEISDVEKIVDSKKSYGGTSRELLREQIKNVKMKKNWQ
jgi:argininosuccinate lyase